MLPGDGLMLVRASGEICPLDSTARERMGPRTADGTGPLDQVVPREGRPVPVRLSTTDDGMGVGLLAPRGSRSEQDPRRVLREAMRHWQPVRQKILNQRRNGRRFWVEIDIAPIADAEGWISPWVSVQRDCEPPA